MKKRIDAKKLVAFLQNDEGCYGTDEIIEDMIDAMEGMPDRAIDELFIWDAEQPIMEMREFARKFYDKIIQGVINVIETAE
ncbi:MAG: hypothetical protein LLF96_03145 [Eubacteriales bacterium]|nr:hypothetical protein [Eubacteriales bacterium]